MNLKSYLEQIQAIAESIKDRPLENVEVVVINPHAPRACDICCKKFAVDLYAHERFPEPVDPDKPEWHKQLRITIPR